MDMRRFLDSNSNERIAEVAAAAGTKVSYMRLIGCGAKRPSGVLARRLDEVTGGELDRRELRPDIFGSFGDAA